MYPNCQSNDHSTIPGRCHWCRYAPVWWWCWAGLHQPPPPLVRRMFAEGSRTVGHWTCLRHPGPRLGPRRDDNRCPQQLCIVGYRSWCGHLCSCGLMTGSWSWAAWAGQATEAGATMGGWWVGPNLVTCHELCLPHVSTLQQMAEMQHH